MNEIRIEKKKSPTWLWWVLGLILVILIVWAIVEAMDDDEPEIEERPVVLQPAPDATPEGLVEAALRGGDAASPTAVRPHA